MLGWRKRKILLQKAQEIFKENNMTREEIIAFLEMGEADYSDGRLDNAADQLSELVAEEKLGLRGLMKLIQYCRKAV